MFSIEPFEFFARLCADVFAYSYSFNAIFAVLTRSPSVIVVDTSAGWYTQCEDITIVAIRIMRIKGMDEQRKIEIDCVII